MSYGLNVYASKGTHSAMGTISSHRAKIFNEDIKLGSFMIKQFDVVHDTEEPLGFLINHPESGNILFLTDSTYSPYTFPSLNNIIIEANYCPAIAKEKLSGMEFLRNRVIQSHMSIDTCIDFLKANDLSAVNNIVLIHLSDSNSNEKEFVQRVNDATYKKTHAAYNGMEIEFNKTPW